MTKLEEAIAHAALEMSREARAELAHRLLAELSDDEQNAVDRAWVEEITRRLDAMDRGEGSSKPSEEVVARLRKKHSA